MLHIFNNRATINFLLLQLLCNIIIVCVFSPFRLISIELCLSFRYNTRCRFAYDVCACVCVCVDLFMFCAIIIKLVDFSLSVALSLHTFLHIMTILVCLLFFLIIFFSTVFCSCISQFLDLKRVFCCFLIFFCFEQRELTQNYDGNRNSI